MLLRVAHDIMTHLNFSITKLRRQCYDGASSMAGSRKDVAMKLMEEEPHALFTHCYGHNLNHRLNLACSDTIQWCKLLRESFDVTQEITQLIKHSPRHDATLQHIKLQLAVDASPGIRILCMDRLRRCIAVYFV